MRSAGPQTPCCRDCNSKLSNRYFDTFYDRCMFIRGYLNGQLKPVGWSQKQINELSGWLRSRVIHDVNKKLAMFNRYDWMDTREFWLNI